MKKTFALITTIFVLFIGGITFADEPITTPIYNTATMGDVTVDYDGRIAQYDFTMLDEIELAYAITVHKSQGSEYPIIVIPLYKTSPKLLTRNLLYTAVTRAKNTMQVAKVGGF